LRRPTEATQVLTAEPPSSRDLWPWLAILCVLVVAGLVGALLAVRHNSQTSSPTTAPALTIAPALRSATTPRAAQPAPRSGVSPSTAAVTVPDVRGGRFPDARKTLRNAGLTAEVTHVSSLLPKQTVVGQTPESGATAAPGDRVLLTVSIGSKDEDQKKGHEKGHGHGRGGDQ
jgi:hypothetical protein